MHHFFDADKVIWALAGISSGAANIIAQTSPDVDPRFAIGVSICTIGIPALSIGLVHAIRNVGPAWIDFRVKLDEARAASKVGLLERTQTVLKLAEQHVIYQATALEAANAKIDSLRQELAALKSGEMDTIPNGQAH